MVIFGWWWTIAKTVLVLAGQLCIAVPGTGAAYLIAVHAIYPMIKIAFSFFLDMVVLALSPPSLPPSSYQYTHTHCNGQSYTHTHDADEIPETFQRVFEERRETAERETRRQNSAAGTNKWKRKGRKRK
jgi:hypothetical protein